METRGFEGRTVDFTNTVVMFASDIEAEFSFGLTENSTEHQKKIAHNQVMKNVKN